MAGAAGSHGPLVGAKLFTVMTVDWDNERAGRIFTSHPEAYPVSGSKPIHRDAWFDVVHKERKPFVANTIADIAKVFPDHETIWGLGCGSVVNLPIEIAGAMVGTVNLLDAEQFLHPGKGGDDRGTEAAGQDRVSGELLFSSGALKNRVELAGGRL